jgi:transposase-like protein
LARRRIISVAAVIAVAVRDDGRRDILDRGARPAKAETFWTEFRRGLKARGLKAAIACVFDGRAQNRTG